MAGQVLGLVGGEETPDSPNAAAQLVAAGLRHHRQQACLRQADVVNSQIPGIRSVPTLSRYESAQTKLDEDAVVALLRFYGVTDLSELDEMRRLVRRSREKEWWSSYRDVVGNELARLFTMESTARVIRTYQEIHIPGMLQTAAYARAVMSALHRKRADGRTQRSNQEKVSRRLHVRKQRQHLLDQPDAPEYCALIAESVLGKLHGGPAVMREQLRQLFNLAENKDRVHIRVLPGAAVQHASALHPSMTLFSFHDEQTRPLIYLEETNRGGEYLLQPEEVEEYQASMEELWELAGTKRDTLRLLQRYIDQLTDNDTD